MSKSCCTGRMYILLMPATALSSFGDLAIFGEMGSRHLELATHRDSSNPPHPSSFGKYPAMRLQNSSCDISISGMAIFFSQTCLNQNFLCSDGDWDTSICRASETNHFHCPALHTPLFPFFLASSSFGGCSIPSKITPLFTSSSIPLKMTTN